jgi:hypothetical protein
MRQHEARTRTMRHLFRITTVETTWVETLVVASAEGVATIVVA